MNTRKYESPLGGDISTHKVPWKSKKARMALALAVSLWIGGSGVAWAEEAADVTVTGIAPNDLTTLEGAGKLAKNQDGSYYDWYLQSPYKKLEITGEITERRL